MESISYLNQFSSTAKGCVTMYACRDCGYNTTDVSNILTHVAYRKDPVCATARILKKEAAIWKSLTFPSSIPS